VHFDPFKLPRSEQKVEEAQNESEKAESLADRLSMHSSLNPNSVERDIILVSKDEANILLYVC
jgi:hypothetical protein